MSHNAQRKAGSTISVAPARQRASRRTRQSRGRPGDRWNLSASGGARFSSVSQADSKHGAAPFDPDPVIEAYKKHVDRTLLRENLKLTPGERLEKLAAFMRSLREVQGAAGPGRR